MLMTQQSEAELQEWAYSSGWQGRCVAKRGGKFGVEIDVLETGVLNPNIDWTGAKVLEAGKGRKIVLKNPQKFLRERVLASTEAQATLRRWLSTTRTNYMFHQFLHLRPKIWMLTGLYELQDVRVGIVSEKHPSFKLGVSSTLTGATTGVPVGAGFEVGLDYVMSSDGAVPEPMVYAARYQLLKAQYLSQKTTPGQCAIELHPDNIYCSGYVMGGGSGEINDDSKADCVVLECSELNENVYDSFDDDEPKSYWKEFESTERKMMRRIKS